MQRTEILATRVNMTSEPSHISNGGWFTYNEATEEFGVDMFPCTTSIGSKLGHAIMGGLEQYDIACLVSGIPQTPGYIDRVYEDASEERVRGLTTNSSDLLYEAIAQSGNLGIDPDVRRNLDFILQDLTDFTRAVAPGGLDASEQSDRLQPYSQAA